jgi:cysteine desulfurase/selenocysteine lyase
MFDIDRVREQFPILNQTVNGRKLVYLDNAASSQIPLSVQEAFVQHYWSDHSNIHRGIHTLAERSTLQYEEARAKVARFIGARPEEVIFTHGATESGNLAAYSILPQLMPGDEIVATEMDHHSNFVPWQQLAMRYGLVFKAIPVKPSYRLDMEEAERMVGPRTRLLAVPHVSNVLGTINPVRELADLAHRYGSVVYVDGAQAVGHLPVNVKDLGADLYGFSGHKMYAPTGIGVLYVRSELMPELLPFHYGGGMIDHVGLKETQFSTTLSRFEAGTPNIAGAICLGAAVDFLARTGATEVHQHEMRLTKELIRNVADIKGVRVIGPLEKDRTGVVSLVVEGMHAHDVSAALDEVGIAIRAGHHCAQPLGHRLAVPATARASVAIYNTVAEVHYFASAIARIAREISEGAMDRSSLCTNVLTTEEEACRQRILDHHHTPRNKRGITAADCCHNGVNPACGDSLTVCLTVRNGVVSDLAYEGYGCAISEAAMSMLTEHVRGWKVEKVRSMGQAEMLAMLGIPVGILKMKCAMLGLRTTQAALAEVKAESGSQVGTMVPQSSPVLMR